MKKLAIVLLISTFSTPIFAQPFDNTECIRVYRDAYIELRDSVDLYNNEQINKWEFSASVSAISTDIGVSRTVCHFTETPDASSCVEKYRDLYKKLRDRIKLSSVISGNQSKVTYTEQSYSVSEGKKDDESVGSMIRNFFRGAREGGERTRQIGELAYIDLKCQN
ncbi:MAG: hypothetical protein OHK0056_05810 [Bacteriovoracaceae bacterium]